jgi:hypothetical protein
MGREGRHVAAAGRTLSQGQQWVELVGDLVIARIRGEPTEQLLRETQEQVLFLVRDAGRGGSSTTTSSRPSPG